MRKLTHLVAGTVVTGGALLAFASPATAATNQWPCPGCYDTTRVETPAPDTARSPVGFAALGGLTAVGLSALALRRRRATDAA